MVAIFGGLPSDDGRTMTDEVQRRGAPTDEVLVETMPGVERSSAQGAAQRLQLLKAVADPTRLAVLDRLAAHGERCHRELELDLGVPANRMSFHLKVLRDAGIVASHRDGKRVVYRLADRVLERLHAALPTEMLGGELIRMPSAGGEAPS